MSNDYDALYTKKGLISHPDWNLVGETVFGNVSEGDYTEVHRSFAEEWLQRLCRDLGGKYHLSATDNFLIVSNQEGAFLKSIERFAEATLSLVQEKLGRIASSVRAPQVLLLLHNERLYKRYVEHYLPLEEVEGAPGTAIREGYGHYVYLADDFEEFHGLYAQEIAMWLMMDLTMLPQWLGEGLSLWMEYEATNEAPIQLSRELKEGHYALWDEESIQTFWTGECFFNSDETGLLAASMADVLLKNAQKQAPNRDAFEDFVLEADYNDAGAGAAQRHLNTTLGTLVARFLGRGAWEPAVVDTPEGPRLAHGPHDDEDYNEDGED